MIIGIDMGHPLRGGGTGAVGIRKETDCNREVGNKVIAKLQELGHTVVNCTTDYARTQTQSLQDRVNLANKQYLDLFVSIHFNCGGGHGTEVYTYNGTDFTQARNIVDNIASLGYRNRGIKDGSNLYVVRHSKAKSMLIECSFIDSREDMNRYNAEDLANAIVKGLVGQTLNVGVQTNSEYGTVTASVLNVRSEATTNSNIIGKLKNGQTVHLFKDCGNGWYSIYFGEHGGYVSKKYVK